MIPLSDVDELEELYASLSGADAMYGGEFLDRPPLIQDWPPVISLDLTLAELPAGHTLYWFTECWRRVGEAVERFCVEGVVTFDDLTIYSADGAILTLKEFIADGKRHREALSARDSRVSIAAQEAAQSGAPTWRPWAGRTVTVSGPLERH